MMANKTGTGNNEGSFPRRWLAFRRQIAGLPITDLIGMDCRRPPRSFRGTIRPTQGLWQLLRR